MRPTLHLPGQPINAHSRVRISEPHPELINANSFYAFLSGVKCEQACAHQMRRSLFAPNAHSVCALSRTLSRNLPGEASDNGMPLATVEGAAFVRRAESVRRAARSRRVRPVRRASPRHSTAAALSQVLVSLEALEHRGWCAPLVAGDGAAARGPLRDTRPRLSESINSMMTLHHAEHLGRGRRLRALSRSRGHLVTQPHITCHAEDHGRHAQDLPRHRKSRQVTPLSRRPARALAQPLWPGKVVSTGDIHPDDRCAIPDDQHVSVPAGWRHLLEPNGAHLHPEGTAVHALEVQEQRSRLDVARDDLAEEWIGTIHGCFNVSHNLEVRQAAGASRFHLKGAPVGGAKRGRGHDELGSISLLYMARCGDELVSPTCAGTPSMRGRGGRPKGRTLPTVQAEHHPSTPPSPCHPRHPCVTRPETSRVPPGERACGGQAARLFSRCRPFQGGSVAKDPPHP